MAVLLICVGVFAAAAASSIKYDKPANPKVASLIGGIYELGRYSVFSYIVYDICSKAVAFAAK